MLKSNTGVETSSEEKLSCDSSTDLNSTGSSVAHRVADFVEDGSSDNSTILPPEPDNCCPFSVTLCIKLPTCERICRRFNYRNDQIKDVIHFAHSFLSNGSNIEEACLSDNSVPVNVYHNQSQTLYEAGLICNTLLHFSYYYR